MYKGGEGALSLATALCISLQIDFCAVLCCAAEESTKYVIGRLSAQAQEITNGYLMNWLDFNISFQHVHIRMWEGEVDVQEKSCWSRNKCALSHHQSLKLDHPVYNDDSYEGASCKSKALHILSSTNTEGEMNE